MRREEDSIDRRIVRNYLTEDGRVIVTAVLQIAGSYVVNILKRLNEQELDQLEESLSALNRVAGEARRERA